MAERTGIIAIAALILSIGTAGFSVYQWWSGRNEARISAAIDFSKRRFEGTGPSIAITPQNQKEATEVILQTRWHEYLAHLINNNRLDDRYLAQVIKCEMTVVLNASKNVQGVARTYVRNQEMEKLKDRYIADCNS
jgi:hypothetical protein